MVAVTIQAASPAHAVVGWFLVLGVAVAGVGPVLTWLGQPRRSTRLLVLGAIFALAGATLLAQTICMPCMPCDPWWLEYFWICV